LDENIKPAKPPKFSATFLEKQKTKLAELRDHILDQMQGVAQDSLREPASGGGSAFGMHQADAGSDAYEKDFALSLLSQEQDALYEIEEALKRIEAGTYGVCEMSGQPIPVNRLEAIPFARFTVDCQSRFEQENKGRNRWESTQPFLETADSSDEEGGEESEEEEKTKSKE
jgi:RNA polymerase-binding transcription factor DksA